MKIVIKYLLVFLIIFTSCRTTKTNKNTEESKSSVKLESVTTNQKEDKLKNVNVDSTKLDYLKKETITRTFYPPSIDNPNNFIQEEKIITIIKDNGTITSKVETTIHTIQDSISNIKIDSSHQTKNIEENKTTKGNGWGINLGLMIGIIIAIAVIIIYIIYRYNRKKI